MQYMGSKRSVVKKILPLILAYKKPSQWWVEPFVGSGAVIENVTGKRIGSDTNKYIIELLIKIRDGWIPPTEISREFYYEVKHNQTSYPPELVGFIGFGCSFGGKWFNGYASNKLNRNYAAEASRSLVKQADKLKGVNFIVEDYTKLDIPSKSLIYCDPPYNQKRKYAISKNFNTSEFWEWCRIKTREGNTVFISEYRAPEDFTCVLEINHKTLMNKNNPVDRIEKLWVYGGV